MREIFTFVVFILAMVGITVMFGSWYTCKHSYSPPIAEKLI